MRKEAAFKKERAVLIDQTIIFVFNCFDCFFIKRIKHDF